ncbi:YhgE/Pip domain-containing protein [Mycoplasma todarodis]|uniref:YhgE/Pip domain-containing protein n=1 Tax=Mycoplasma todarodis TaxID=1937191 RepID=UPI003B395DC7
MWKLIREDLRELTSNRWKTFGMFLLLLLPALYASIFISAFQNPVHNSDNANIKVVSLDNKDLSNKVKKSMVGKHKIDLHVDEYNMTIKDASDVYKTREAAENAVKEGTIDGVFIIPKGFDSGMRIAALQVIENVMLNKANAFENVKLPTINFYTSYKRNYVSARLQGMRADIVTLKSQFVSGTLKQIIKEISQQKGIPFDAILAGINIEEKIKTFKDGFIQFETIGGREINDYGNALFPYFFSIALWAGCLMMIFMYKNRRVGPIAQKAGTFKNYFAKTILWVSTAMIQSLLMSTLCLAIGLKVESPGYLIGYTLFVAIIFALICQGISSIFRVGEVGSFMVLIILIIQLSVSSGVFPVTMQAPAWGKMAPLVPFTYTIASFRELFVDTDNAVVWLHQWPIFIYLGFIPLSLTVNYFADKKRFKKYGHYTSHDPDVHDEH